MQDRSLQHEDYSTTLWAAVKEQRWKTTQANMDSNSKGAWNIIGIQKPIIYSEECNWSRVEINTEIQ